VKKEDRFHLEGFEYQNRTNAPFGKSLREAQTREKNNEEKKIL
jgi:hypothetical protein